MGAIYSIQNLANGKVYVGQTVKPSWRDRYVCPNKPQIHFSCRLLKRAVLKHGIEKFRFDDLMTNVPKEALDFWETFWIKSLGACETASGYNLETGGRAQKVIHPETRARMSKSMMGKNRGKTWKWNSTRRAHYTHESHGMYKPLTWQHPVHGTFVGGGRQLKEAFPDQPLQTSNLSKVAHGIRPHCGGWRCLDAKTNQQTLNL